MKAILNMYNSYMENTEVGEGEYVVANTNEFGLEEGKKYKILEVNSLDTITVEVYRGHIDMYTIEYFDKHVI